MQLARFVRRSAVLLVLGLAGFGGGCGSGSATPVDQERENQIKASKKAAHQDLKSDIKKGQDALKQQGASRKDAHRRGAAR
jgi:hypothetical protein